MSAPEQHPEHHDDRHSPEFEPRGTLALGVIYVALLVALWSYAFILLLQRR
ncbi:MAG: hypothetical protein Q9O62_14665 [Ardenticatenia bacterium]|nr:hypothetical protein [Ardenticatenia bacterium]